MANEQVHPIFKDILNSVQNLEKSVNTSFEEQGPSPAEMKAEYIELLNLMLAEKLGMLKD